ncbi:MAG: hypothetical protein AB8B59_06755 [Maribacter sp.]
MKKKSILIEFLNPNQNIHIFKPLVAFMGSHDKAVFLHRLIYWSSGKRKNGWVAKSYLEWYEEILVDKRPIMAASDYLKSIGVLETEVKKFNRFPTVHYKLNLDVMDKILVEFIQNGSPKKKQKPRGAAVKKIDTSTNLDKGEVQISTKGKVGTNLNFASTNKARTITKSTQGIIVVQEKNEKPQPISLNSQYDVEYQITQLGLTQDSMSNRIKIFELIQDYMETEDFKTVWTFMTDRIAGDLDAEKILKEWVTKADWHFVKGFKLNKISGWIKNASNNPDPAPMKPLDDFNLSKELNEKYKEWLTDGKEKYPALWKSNTKYLSKKNYFDLIQYFKREETRIHFTKREFKNKIHECLDELNKNKFLRDSQSNVYEFIMSKVKKQIKAA